MLDLAGIPIVEHHVHALLRRQPQTVPDYLILFTEADDPNLIQEHVPNTVFVRWALRELADFLGCAPTPEAVLAARNRLPLTTWAQRCFQSAGIQVLLLDMGFRQEENLTLEEMAHVTGCQVAPILRLETLAESLILRHSDFDAMLEAFRGEVAQARDQGYVALKSIIAYRTGLDIRVTESEEAAAAFALLREQATRAGRVRLAAKPLCDFLVLQALEVAEAQALPIQFHTGFGDRDLDLRLANPLHLRGVLESGRFTHVPFVVLHAGYPYVRETAYLTAVYPNVYADISLAVPFAAGDILALLREMLGLAPWTKVMYSSDAFSIPELFWLAARMGRRGLSRVLEELVQDGLLTWEEARDAAAAMLHTNARRLYGLAYP